VIPSRRTQPYRRGAREPSSSLGAMLAGRSPSLGNPMDAQREAMKRRPVPARQLAHGGLGVLLMRAYHAARDGHPDA
jgi:hypothetical protein